MPKRILHHLAISLSIVFSLAMPAQAQDSNAEVKRLQTLLYIINAEIKSDLDQILVLQEAVKANARPPLESQGRTPEVLSYNDLADAQRRAIERETALNARLDSLLQRSAALDAKKQGVLEQMMQLGAIAPEPAPKQAPTPR